MSTLSLNSLASYSILNKISDNNDVTHQRLGKYFKR